MSFVFENVSKQFLNQNESTLQRINLEIQTGEFVCIVGKSGCGKSTLLNLAAGLLTPSSGRILLDGKEVNGREWRGLSCFRNTLCIRGLP